MLEYEYFTASDTVRPLKLLQVIHSERERNRAFLKYKHAHTQTGVCTPKSIISKRCTHVLKQKYTRALTKHKLQCQTRFSRSLSFRRKSRCSRTPIGTPSLQTALSLLSCSSMTKTSFTNAWPPCNAPRLWTTCKSCCLCVTCSANCE